MPRKYWWVALAVPVFAALALSPKHRIYIAHADVRIPDEQVTAVPADIVLTNGRIYTMDAEHAWATGVVVGRQVSERLELDGELYATANTNGTDRSNTFGGGGRCKLGGPLVLLFMAGRSFRGPASGQPQLIGYLGMQFLFSTKHKKENPQRFLSAPR